MNVSTLSLSLKNAETAEIEARRRKNKLKDKHDQLILKPRLLSLIGKTFRYPKNCYSCPSKPSDYWPVYARITGLKRMCLEVIEFQTDCRGHFKWDTNFWGNDIRVGFVPCSQKEYLEEFKKQISKVKP